jgi:hypothetical protein
MLPVFQERLRASGHKLSDADALAFLRKQKSLLIRAALPVPPGSDASVTALARRAVRAAMEFVSSKAKVRAFTN